MKLYDSCCHHELISISRSPSCKSFSVAGNEFIRILLRWAFDVLPQVSQITCGGAPNSSSKFKKSLSFVITTTDSRHAVKNIS